MTFGKTLCWSLSISMCMQSFIEIFQKGSRDRVSFIFIRIWTSAKHRPMTNGIWQLSLGLDLVNIHNYVKAHQTFHTLQKPMLYTHAKIWCLMSELMLYIKIWCFSKKRCYIQKCNMSELMLHTKMLPICYTQKMRCVLSKLSLDRW